MRIQIRDIRKTDGSDPDFLMLCQKLDSFLDEAAGGAENRADYIPHNGTEDIHNVLIAYHGGIPIGCASFKVLSSDTAEVKRVFLRPGVRGKGIGETLMRGLEHWAADTGVRRLVLETGDILTAATALYRRLGYEVIPNYGPYVDLPASLCMGKVIGGQTANLNTTSPPDSPLCVPLGNELRNIKTRP